MDGSKLALGATAIIAGAALVPPLRGSRARRRPLPSRAIHQSLLLKALAMRRRGEPSLGRGNFGEAYRVDDWIVKLPVAKDIHGRDWNPERLRGWFENEAMVSEIARQRTDMVPEIVFVDLGPTGYGLVREYGEPVLRLTPQEFDALERTMMDLELNTKLRVRDDIDPYRRSDGSVFVGDVGFWQIRDEPGLGGRGEWYWDSDLVMLFDKLDRDHLWLDMPLLTRIADSKRRFESLWRMRDRLEAKGRDVSGFDDDLDEAEREIASQMAKRERLLGRRTTRGRPQ